jgi:hypothetical protein
MALILLDPLMGGGGGLGAGVCLFHLARSPTLFSCHKFSVGETDK